MRVIVDKERCVGSGSCVLTAPAVFDQDDDEGKVILLADSPDEAFRAQVVESANVCPTAALRVAE
jgi:ferredoxin